MRVQPTDLCGADPPVLIVVHVRPTDSDHFHVDEHARLLVAGSDGGSCWKLGYWVVPYNHVVGAAQKRCWLHEGSCGGCRGADMAARRTLPHGVACSESDSFTKDTGGHRPPGCLSGRWLHQSLRPWDRHGALGCNRPQPAATAASNCTLTRSHSQAARPPHTQVRLSTVIKRPYKIGDPALACMALLGGGTAGRCP